MHSCIANPDWAQFVLFVSLQQKLQTNAALKNNWTTVNET